MKTYSTTLIFCAFVLAGPAAMADGGKDCLLKGTVQHGEQAGQETTTVKIHSISQYDDESRCNMQRGQKLEFKLPQDPRLQEAPSGSAVKYRYRTDDKGGDSSELISVGA
jgi:hypothetical protein